MPITQQKLAERLRSERERLDFTQEEVAEWLGVKRPTVAQIEAGNRAVTSIELSQFAALFKRDVSIFLSDLEPEEAAGIVRLRANGELDEPVQTILEECVRLCQSATHLESLLGMARKGVPFSYAFDRPHARWEAVEQGKRLATMERKRLELGSLPVRNIVEIIAQHGVRVARHTLTDDIAGIFFVGSDTGMAILVNAGHTTARRLFSYAHEYAHLLVDSVMSPDGISRFGNRDDLLEVRANAFAAHFLMPDEGVRAFFDGLGGPTRQITEIYDGFMDQPENQGEVQLTAQRRFSPRSQDVEMIDVLRLARHFGASYEATVYHLLNLKLIQKEAQQQLLLNKERAEKVNTLFGGPVQFLERETMADLKQVMINLIVEAWLQKKLPRLKAYEYMQQIHMDPQALDSVPVLG